MSDSCTDLQKIGLCTAAGVCSDEVIDVVRRIELCPCVGSV